MAFLKVFQVLISWLGLGKTVQLIALAREIIKRLKR